MNNFILIEQREENDCGVACLEMIARNHNLQVTRKDIITWVSYKGEMTSLKQLSEGLSHLGFHAMAIKVSTEKLVKDISFPCIAHLSDNHYVVIYDQVEDNIFIANPALEKNICIDFDVFSNIWSGNLLLLGQKESVLPSVKKNILNRMQTAAKESDLSILTNAIDHYFEPVLQRENKPLVQQEIGESKDNLIIRLREKFFPKTEESTSEVIELRAAFSLIKFAVNTKEPLNLFQEIFNYKDADSGEYYAEKYFENGEDLLEFIVSLSLLDQKKIVQYILKQEKTSVKEVKELYFTKTVNLF